MLIPYHENWKTNTKDLDSDSYSELAYSLYWLHYNSPVFKIQAAAGRNSRRYCSWLGAYQVSLVVKNPLANARDIRNTGSIPGSGRFPGEGHGSPLQYSCLENPMDRGAWWATVQAVAQSWIPLKRLISHSWLSLGERYWDVEKAKEPTQVLSRF